MKQGLSLRVSQHLALTPQLQQSIRLLQLSTLELSQEVDQMLDENPFLELSEDRAEREDFGLPQADTPVSEGDRDSEFSSAAPLSDLGSATVSTTSSDEDNAPLGGDEGIDWDGDGSTEMSPDDG
jgi:RNA polymerase sigma-54 factor